MQNLYVASARPAAGRSASVPVRLTGPPTQTLAQVVRDTVTDCPDLAPFLDETRPLGSVHFTRTSYELEWWVRFFEQDPASLERYRRLQRAIGQAFRDVYELAKATGSERPIDPRMVELVKQRVALAYYPSAGLIAERALSGSPAFAAAALRRYIRPEQWWERNG